MNIVSDGKDYTGVERRSSEERRMRVNRRANIRFDETAAGGRRESMGRRSNDEHLENLE